MLQVLEELVVSKDQNHQIIKGKRTKRQRLPSPLRLTMMPSASYNSSGGGGGSSLETEEEEDMANCLILLAQGHHRTRASPPPRHQQFHNNNNNNVNSNYQCKTCNRCFSSSQALGGHRASHSKLLYKGTAEEKLANKFVNINHDDPTTNTILSLQIPNRVTFNATATTTSTRKSKVHECSVCGAEFSSGQALGGHMRRHRTPVMNTSITTSTSLTMSGGGSPKLSHHQLANKRLKLDLNLPAAPDHDESKFSFQPRSENVIAFSTSSLVGCHY